MPVTKYFARVWSSPKQKEQILFKTDPVLQRPIRVGCCRTSIYVPPVTSYNFNIWTAASGTTFTTSGNGVAYGNDKWVAVGSGTNKILYSDDGTTWTAASGATFSNSGLGVAYGNDKWVAVGSGSGAKILYSDDGITWSAASGATFTTSGNDVAYADGKWVAVGRSTNKILYSEDGITWTAASGTTFSLFGNDVAYADGKWVAVGGNSPGSTIISLDGTIIPGYFT